MQWFIYVNGSCKLTTQDENAAIDYLVDCWAVRRATAWNLVMNSKSSGKVGEHTQGENEIKVEYK